MSVLFPSTIGTASTASSGCLDYGNVLVGTFHTTIVNCSDSASTTQLANVLAGTDAYRLGLLAGKDRFLANNQWLVWIDTHSAPGIIRGLWPIAASGTFVGHLDNGLGGTGGNKSLLSLMDRHHPGTPSKYGYMGLNVEIWGRKHGTPGEFFMTYRHDGTNSANYTWNSTKGPSSSAHYDFQLFNPANGSPTFRGFSGGVSHNVRLRASYTITPTNFQVLTALSSAVPVDADGDLGGLLLQPAPACGPRQLSCPNDVGSKSMHVLEATNAGAGNDTTGCAPDNGNVVGAAIVGAKRQLGSLRQAIPDS